MQIAYNWWRWDNGKRLEINFENWETIAKKSSNRKENWTRYSDGSSIDFYFFDRFLVLANYNIVGLTWKFFLQ